MGAELGDGVGGGMGRGGLHVVRRVAIITSHGYIIRAPPTAVSKRLVALCFQARGRDCEAYGSVALTREESLCGAHLGHKRLRC